LTSEKLCGIEDDEALFYGVCRFMVMAELNLFIMKLWRQFLNAQVREVVTVVSGIHLLRTILM
jgi:hypothetical protein